MIDAILEGDSRVPRKQRHTAKRVFERLRDEYGFDGSVHHSQGLRQEAWAADAGDVRAVVPCAGPRPVRFGGGGGHRWWRGAQGALLRAGLATPQQGVSPLVLDVSGYSPSQVLLTFF